ncbi:MAG: hypothetical protein JNM47_07935 [Hyphomonadaceae bacterium]|nr:hypothetical protein [Hyphomonadaceae bacterium]
MTKLTETSGAAKSRRKLKVWQWYLIACLVAGGIYGFVSEMDFALVKSPVTILIVAAVVVVFAMVVSLIWMNEIDELARQAHYEAWFWGGSTGLGFLLFLMLAAPALPGLIDFQAIEDMMAPFAGEGGAFLGGVMASILILTLCYGAWWIFFWLRKR